MAGPLQAAAARALDDVHGRLGRTPRAEDTAGRGRGAEAFFESAGRADPPPTPRGRTSSSDDAAPGGDGTRLVVHELVVQRTVHGAHVFVTLSLGERRSRGIVEGVPTRRGLHRAVAEAALDAARELCGPPLLVGVDRVTVSGDQHPPSATVVLTSRSARGDETLVGVALLHDDPDAAVLHATLDACNRRVEELLVDRPAPEGT